LRRSEGSEDGPSRGISKWENVTMLYFLPEISQQDYDTFRHVVSDLPATHGEWLKLRLKQGKRMQNQGDTLHPIEVTPDEFVEHCNKEAATRNLSSFWACAQDKGRKRLGPV